MAEKDQQVYPLPVSTNTQAKHDEDEEAGTVLSKEAGTVPSKELRKKRMKCLAYVVAFAVFQIGIILVFALTVMKIKTPKFRVRSATFESFNVVTTTSAPSFDMKMNAELGVKNTNFGHYKFDNSTIYFFYKGTQVGSAFVSKARARARSTKKFNVVVDLTTTNLPSNSGLGDDFNSGVLQLTSQSELKGKVELMKVMKKKKSTEMSCTLTISLADKAIRDLNCR